MALNENGHEILDDTPVSMPVGFKRPMSMTDMIRQYVKTEMSKQASDSGQESWEEADDFDIGDDYDPKSPWELTFDQEFVNNKIESMTEQKPASLGTNEAEPSPASGSEKAE
jgi:hypothetical protein